MKKLLFLSALALMGIASVGCTTTDNNKTAPAPIETTTPGTTTHGNTTNGTTNGTATNGNTTNGTTNGTATNDMTTNGTTANTDNAKNGVVTDTNGMINNEKNTTLK